ncbi:MAG: methyltransferase domain-containing protein [Planctomycetes bacterium]|nr:methyltransferase domain-containing protein [Planctomycetota bacterium]
MPADWQLPIGVSRSLWDYFHDPEIARGYDADVGDTPLLRIDQQFVREHCQPPGRIIDLGCGTGRLALPLAEHGYQPVAVDLSPEMLKVLGEKAAARGLTIPRICANIAALDIFADASFDHAACLFSTLGLIVGAEARRRAIAHVFRLLRPGGVFVLHVHNRWHNLWTSHGRWLLWNDLWSSWFGGGEAGDYEMPPRQGVGALTMHLFTRREVTGLLQSAGFEIVEVRPVSLNPDGRLACPWWFGRLRAYGYMIAVRKPLAA